MNLELKYLTPYLPYNLGLQVLNYKSDYVGLQFSTINGFYLIGDKPHSTYHGGSTGKSFSEFKPVLRPMSDLRKYNDSLGCTYDDFLHNNIFDGEHVDEENTITKFIYQLCNGYIKMSFLQSLRLREFFSEHHFDFLQWDSFHGGLIDAGVAIDINTLEGGVNHEA